MLAVLVREDLLVELEDRDDELDRLHSHVELLVEGHRDDPVLELAREQLQLPLQLLAGVQRLKGLEALQPHVTDLVVKGPADVLEVGVVQEVLVELLQQKS